MRHLVTLIDQLRDKNISFRSVCDGAIASDDTVGQLIARGLLGRSHEFERRLIQERTKAGLEAALRPVVARAAARR